MSSISFDNPYLLLLAIPLVVLFSIPFFIAVKKSNANFHNITAGVIHIFIALIIALAAAGMTVKTTVTETDVYVLADVSYSANRNLDTLDNYIEELKDNLPANSKLGVVCFAKNQQMLVPLGKSLKSVKGVDFDFIDDSETDIESALDYASTLFRDDVIKRIVVMTDGKQTHVSDVNALKRAVDELRAGGVLVDAVYLDDNISDDAKEVQIISAEVTQNTYVDRDETVVLSVRSTYSDVRADLTITEEGAVRQTRSVVLNKGYNTFEMSLDTSKEGTVNYEVTINAEGDENSLNNNIKFSQNVSGSVKVLIICDNKFGTDAEYLRQRYNNYSEVDVYDTGDDIPSTIPELCAYDEIVLSDVDLRKANDYALLIGNLNTAVSMFGKSLVTYGNVYTYDKDNDNAKGGLSVLADMLPVRYGNADRDAKLYTLVIDASRSMETISKMSIAKTAAKQLVNKLNDGDYVCVVTFNGNYRTVLDPTELNNENSGGGKVSSKEVCDAIDNIGLEHGTVISFGLEQALEKIKGLDFSQKQIMLISDGLTVDNGNGNETKRINDVVDKLVSLRIATSVIDVGRGTDTSSTAVNAESLLKSIAEKSKGLNGTYTLITSDKDVADVMFREGVFDGVDSVVIDDNASVRVLRSTDSVLENVTMSSEYVEGFVYNRQKAGSTVVLALVYNEKNVPLYAYWNYGKGRVASMSAGVEQTYIEDIPWASRNILYNNIVTTNVPSEKINSPFVTELIEDNGYIKINAIPAQFDTDIEITVSYTVPDGEGAVGDKMSFSGAAYSYSFETSAVGKYSITIEYKTAGGDLYYAYLNYSVSFLAEYDSFAVYDISTLYRMIGNEGTVMKEGDVIEIVNDEDSISFYTYELAVPLLITVVVLFFIDIAIRKLKWADIRSLIGHVKK